jgi:hypothetical protein
MLAEKRWVNWQYETRGGDKATKVPYQPSGVHAKTNDPATWSNYTDLAAGRFAGFVLGDGWFGVDLDNSKGADWELEITSHFPDAYIETSPSGKGTKIFCRGVDAVKGRKKLRGNGAIEVYGAGRYFAVTRETIQEDEPGDCSAGLKWLLETYFPELKVASPVAQQPNTAIEERVAKYLAKCPPAIGTGGQGGHNHTFHVAGQLVHGFALSPEAALPLFQVWNSTCVPPWSDADLERKLHQAAKATCDKPRGWLLNEQNGEWASAPDGGADLSEIGKVKEKSPERLPFEIYENLPGVIKEIVEHNLATALYPQPEIALAGAIALVSTLIGRKVTDAYNTRSNLYVVALAESGSGKDHSRDMNRRILTAANCSMLEGPEELASSAGIVASLVEHPARLLQIDEIGDVFGVIRGAGNKSPWLASILRLLKSLYSSSKGEFRAGGYKSIEQNKIIDQPSLTIYGNATEDFWESISPKVVKDGTLGRTVVFGPVPSQQYKGRPPAKTMPTSIVAFAKAWSEWMPGGILAKERPCPITIQHSPSANARAEEHMVEISRRALKEEGHRRAIWMRSGEKTNKLALLFASSRWVLPPSAPIFIELADVELAIQIANWTTRKCVSEVFDQVYENDRERMMKRILKICEKPQSKTALIRATQGMSARSRDELMQEMISIGQIMAETQQGERGPPKTVFQRGGVAN